MQTTGTVDACRAGMELLVGLAFVFTVLSVVALLFGFAALGAGLAMVAVVSTVWAALGGR